MKAANTGKAGKSRSCSMRSLFSTPPVLRALLQPTKRRQLFFRKGTFARM